MSVTKEENFVSHPMIFNEKTQQIHHTDRTNQYLGGLTVSLGGFCAGTVLAWTSPALEYIKPDDRMNSTSNNATSTTRPGFKLSTSEEALVGATLMLGGLIFAIPSGKFADIFGRKFTLVLIAFLYLANYIVIACATDVMMLVVARFLAGLALGGSCVVSPMYIGEIAEDSLRGVLGSLFNVLLALGILYTNIIGIFSNWVGLNVGLALAAVVAGILILFFPDTPVYFVAQERFGRAKRSLAFFRRSKKVATEELAQLQKRIAEQEDEGTLLQLFTKKRYRKPLIAGLGIFIYQQLCGINIVVFYMTPIFRAAGSSITPPLASSITNLISLLVGVTAVFVIEKRNRKYFLMLSSISMLIGTAGLGLFFQLKQHNLHFQGLQVLPLSCVILLLAAFSIGLGPVPWILMIELYSPEIRAVAGGVVVVSNWLSAFVVTFSYPYLMHFLGSASTFYLFSLLNVLGIAFIWFVVPETRTKICSK